MNLALYVLTVFLWGTSWIAIKFQLGVVAPEVSVAYRFAIAAVIMAIFCLGRRLPMRFSRTDHMFMAMQGLFLFSTNYLLIYLGSQYLATGLVAVAFSTIVAINILGSAELFRAPVAPKVVAGALLGLSGITLVFWPEVRNFGDQEQGALGLFLALLGTVSASAGMLTSAWSQKCRGLPVIQTNTYGMVYGAAIITAFIAIRGSTFEIEVTPQYLLSLTWLSLFATVVAFWSYLTLVGRIGADRAAYATVLFPIIALALSTVFEGYRWTMPAAAGLGLVLIGNALVLAKTSAAPANRSM